jgi:hypothetical protein
VRSLRLSVRGTFSLGKRSFQALTGIQRSLLQLSNNQLPTREAGVCLSGHQLPSANGKCSVSLASRKILQFWGVDKSSLVNSKARLE